MDQYLECQNYGRTKTAFSKVVATARKPYLVDALNVSRREQSVIRPSTSAIVTGLRATRK